MGKTLNKVKVSMATLRVTILSLFSKAIGQNFGDIPKPYIDVGEAQLLYGVQSPIESTTNLIVKLAQWIIIPLILIIGIINLIKIKKIDDKIQRKKRIRRTIIIMSILVVVLVAAFLIPTLLLK